MPAQLPETSAAVMVMAAAFGDVARMAVLAELVIVPVALMKVAPVPRAVVRMPLPAAVTVAASMTTVPAPLLSTTMPLPLDDVTPRAVTRTLRVPPTAMSMPWALAPPMTFRLYNLAITSPEPVRASMSMAEPPALLDPETFRSPSLTDTSPAPVFLTRTPSCPIAPMAAAVIVTSASAPALA